MALSWRLFVFSVRFVFEYLKIALRVSGVLIAGLVVLELSSSLLLRSLVASGVTNGMLVLFVLHFILAIIVYTWFSIVWHRWVLLDELDINLVPKWPSGSIVGYAWRELLVEVPFLLFVGITILIGGGLFSLGLDLVAGYFLVGLGAIVGTYLTFRVGLILPAFAIGSQLSLRAAWDITRGRSAPIFGFSIFYLLGFAILGGVQFAMSELGFYSPVVFVYQTILTWFFTVVGINAQTTLYGYYVEGRKID